MNTEDLMQERPDDISPARSSITDLVGVDTEEDVDFTEDESGFGVVDPSFGSTNREGMIGVKSYGATEAGMTAHRGVLQDGEYADPELLQQAIEAELGYTYAEITAVYKQGPKSATQREFRAYVDARLLALSSSGTNIEVLAAALGLTRLTIDRAIARARELHVEPQGGFTPAITRPCMCFICQDMTAKPRKRRFSASPPSLRGTINLCTVDYSAGFDMEPGNPAYWEFRRRQQ